MDLIEVPEKVYSVAQFDLCWCGAVSTGWLVAGEWLATNLVLKTKPVWTDSMGYLGDAVGALGWWATIASSTLDIKGNQKHRRILGSGYLLFAAVMGKHWDKYKILPKIAIPVHACMGAFLWLTKPKAAKAAK